MDGMMVNNCELRKYPCIIRESKGEVFQCRMSRENFSSRFSLEKRIFHLISLSLRSLVGLNCRGRGQLVDVYSHQFSTQCRRWGEENRYGNCI